MKTIAGFPYFEVQFTKDGAIYDTTEVQAVISGLKEAKATDLLAFSHGWNNDMDEARQLYEHFFTSFRDVLDSGYIPNLKDRTFAVLAILWPSKKFADEDLIPSGAASFDGVVTDEAVKDKVNQLKSALDSPKANSELEQARDMVPNLEFDPALQDAFVKKIRSVLPPGEADEEIANDFFTLPGNEIFQRLIAPPGLAAERSSNEGGAADMPDATEGGAVGLGDIFSGIKAAAMRVLNYATYYVMKNRAGVVGRDGLSKVVKQILTALPNLRIHLIGHSFGGRVVTAAADALGDKEGNKPASMSLLQAAFSHNGFATKFDGTRDGFFRKVVSEKKVKGPIIITYTENDRAVGIAYPIASKLSGVDASALGDANDRFGGLGRNGALVRFTPEAAPGDLLGTDKRYSFSPGKLFNLKATAFIKDHGDVTGREVAAAVLSAVAATA